MQKEDCYESYRSLHDFFSSKIYARGESYFERGLVEDVHIEEEPALNRRVISGIVVGSERYETCAHIDTATNTFLDFDCTCPYDAYCKHAVALALAYLYTCKEAPNPESYAYEESLEHDFLQSLREIDIDPTTLHEDTLKRLEKVYKTTHRRDEKTKIYSPQHQTKTQATRASYQPSLSECYLSYSCSYSISLTLFHSLNHQRIELDPDDIQNAKRYTNPEKEFLLLYTAYSQNGLVQKKPVDLVRLFELIDKLSIPLGDIYGSYSKPYRIQKPTPLDISLNYEAEYSEFRQSTQPVFTLSHTPVRNKQQTYLKSYHSYLLYQSGRTIAIHALSERIAPLLARMQHFSRYTFQKRDGHDSLSTQLQTKDIASLSEIIIDLRQYTNLTTNLTPPFIHHTLTTPRLELSIEYHANASTLSIVPYLYYGERRYLLGESVYARMYNGRMRYEHTLTKYGYYEHDNLRIEQHLYTIKRNLRRELTLFKQLYTADVGFSKILTIKHTGNRAIFSFYQTEWPKLVALAKKLQANIVFPEDTLAVTSVSFRADVAVEADTSRDWLAFDASYYGNDIPLSLSELRTYIQRNDDFLVREDGTLLHITNHDELQRFVQLLEQFSQTEDKRFESKLYNAPALEYVLTGSKQYNVRREKSFASFIKEAQSGKPVQRVRLSPNTKKLLRDYQQEGINWLYFLRKYRFGGILADDMGLGKTLQALILLERERMPDKPSLVLCPKTLLHNWFNEAKKFTPTLKVLVIEGTKSERIELLKQATDFDLVVAGYASLQKDSAWYEAATFNYVLLDEAQYIKNHATKTAQLVKKLNAEYRLALTGTPLENSVLELWSLFDFLMPNFLGTHASFVKQFQTPIMHRGDERALMTLREKVSCFMLRRSKKEVLKELPAKIEHTQPCYLGKEQNLLYQEVLARTKKELFEQVKEKGFKRSQIHILAALTKLRQICNHPALLLDSKKHTEFESTKLDTLFTLLDDIVSSRRKVLIFSQFTQMLDIISSHLNYRSIAYTYLSGKTKKRAQVVETFMDTPAIPVFLISLKAGGVGLNLTVADNVIIFDPWWNPSVEQQAIDRTHRIGQTKSVNVYRLITHGTIEEKIVALQEQKQHLFDSLISENADIFKKLTWDEVKELFR